MIEGTKDVNGYWLILSSTIVDEEAQATYAQLWKPIAEKYAAKLRVLNTTDHLLESQGYARVLVVEFSSYEKAEACYFDEAYQAAKVFANRAAKRELLLLRGDAPQ